MKLPALAFFLALGMAVAQVNTNQGGEPEAAKPILNLAGICAVVNKTDGKVVITQILPGGAAEKAGLLEKDVILEVDGVLLDGMDLQTAVGLMRGAPGTLVTLTIARDWLPTPQAFVVTREVIRLR